MKCTRDIVFLIVIILLLSGCNIAVSDQKSSIETLTEIDTVPFLNQQWKEDYFIGNGILGGGGNNEGVWNFLIGPDYTSPNFLKTEILTINLNGEERNISADMHRIRKSGIYYGTKKINEAEIHIFEYATPEKPMILRHIIVENKSESKSLNFQLKAVIKKAKQINEKIIDNNALLLKADSESPLFGNGDGGYWKDSYALIAFNSMSKCVNIDSVQTLSTEKFTITPGQKKNVALVHYVFDDKDNSIIENLNEIKSLNISQNLIDAEQEWNNWINKGETFCNEDLRVKDILESMLVGIRMQQSRCGGFIAGTRKYAFSYIRDSHGACKGLLACGHTEEVKRYLEITNHKFHVFKSIPNSVQMGADEFSHADGNQYAESPAYVLLLAKDYYEATKDLDFLKSIDDLLSYAIDIQVENAKINNWLLPFNGDETEQYCLKIDGTEYGGFPSLTGFNRDQWSMTSVAACIASLDFYIDYLNLKKMDESIKDYQMAMIKMKKSLIENFHQSELGGLQWAVKTDGTFYPYNVTNFVLMPVWFGVSLKDDVEKSAIENLLPYINSKTGFIALAPGEVEGFCGHTLALLLYGLTQLNLPEKDFIYNTLINSSVIQRYGMVNEFYGPKGSPNPHNLRVFESGIVIDALVNYLKNNQ